MIHIEYSGPPPPLRERQILTRPAEDFFREAILDVSRRRTSTRDDWTLTLEPSLLFDASGLRVLIDALRGYRGPASTLHFRLRLDPAAYRDYYSLGSRSGDPGRVVLPVTAKRSARDADRTETLDIELASVSTYLAYPRSLTAPEPVSTPLALLMELRGDFDLLFANQVALFAALARDVPRHPRAWARALLRRRGGDLRRRLSLAYTRVHRKAEIHPTAVIEGSVVGAGARIGAHCVVRYSHIGERAQLFDGAKVECSVVGPGSWLLHDLVLIRSHVEDEVFLIHGPYQFSCFHTRSAAFATIMMDYRPDAKPIKAMTFDGVREYAGRFLGAVLKQGAKSLGGSLLSPGIIIPEDTWLGCDLEAVHRPARGPLPRRQVVAPRAEGRRNRNLDRSPSPFAGGSHDADSISDRGRTRPPGALDRGSTRRGMGG